MRVVVYFEGVSDVKCMESLFSPKIAQSQAIGIDIEFYSVPESENLAHNKRALLKKYPKKAAIILRNESDSVVAIMPDLYPQMVAFAHNDVASLREGLMAAFAQEISNEEPAFRDDMKSRFHVFCFKHDLEALLLAIPDALAAAVGQTTISQSWVTPVEDQNFNKPPKLIVEGLFKQFGRRYSSVNDAPALLSSEKMSRIRTSCNQCFDPFVTFLESFTLIKQQSS